MKRVSEDFRLVHSALTHFAGEMVINMSDDTMEFETVHGDTGVVAQNDNFYDIYVGSELVYRVESDFFEICNYNPLDCDIIGLYRRLQAIDPMGLQYRSRTFYRVVKESVENLILDMQLPLVQGDVRIKNYHVFYTPENRVKINLN